MLRHAPEREIILLGALMNAIQFVCLDQIVDNVVRSFSAHSAHLKFGLGWKIGRLSGKM